MVTDGEFGEVSLTRETSLPPRRQWPGLLRPPICLTFTCFTACWTLTEPSVVGLDVGCDCALVPDSGRTNGFASPDRLSSTPARGGQPEPEDTNLPRTPSPPPTSTGVGPFRLYDTYKTQSVPPLRQLGRTAPPPRSWPLSRPRVCSRVRGRRHPLDIATAKKGDAVSVGMASGHYSTDQLAQAGADFVLASLEEPFPGP